MRKKRIGKLCEKHLCPASGFCLGLHEEERQENHERRTVFISLARMCGVSWSYKHFQLLNVRTAHLVTSIRQRCSSDENFPDISCMFGCLSWQEVCESVVCRRSVFVQ
jgi:hypothetical protein